MVTAGSDTLECVDAFGLSEVRILSGPSRPFSPW
jgi:hypothetical protein